MYNFFSPLRLYLLFSKNSVEATSIDNDISISETLKYYMGKNTPERQVFIMDNLIIDDDLEN